VNSSAVAWIAILTGAVLSAACESPPPRSTAEERPPVSVATVCVDMTDLPSAFEAGGIVRARATALIASRVMAPITTVHVHAGDRVKRGAVLVTLDARDADANKARAGAASLAAAETMRAAEGDLRAAESALELARLTHNRMASLHATRSATTEELDRAVASLASAEAQLSSGHARLAAATAGREAAEAAAEAAAIATTYTTLTAPFDGIVTDRNADAGTMATPAMPLVTIEDSSRYRLEVQLDEARAAAVTLGQGVQVRFDQSMDAVPVEGAAVEIARVDPTSHAFLVKIDLPHGIAVRSGLFGRARFPGPSRRALAVPTSTLVTHGQLTFVYVVDTDGRARLRPISIGSSAGDRVEVLAGLRAGDVIVSQPPPALVDGVSVPGVRP
jgi:multidrug efflux pump subunit AcrA (membrane-fusion protein)